MSKDANAYFGQYPSPSCYPNFPNHTIVPTVYPCHPPPPAGWGQIADPITSTPTINCEQIAPLYEYIAQPVAQPPYTPYVSDCNQQFQQNFQYMNTEAFFNSTITQEFSENFQNPPLVYQNPISPQASSTDMSRSIKELTVSKYKSRNNLVDLTGFNLLKKDSASPLTKSQDLKQTEFAKNMDSMITYGERSSEHHANDKSKENTKDNMKNYFRDLFNRNYEKFKDRAAREKIYSSSKKRQESTESKHESRRSKARSETSSERNSRSTNDFRSKITEGSKRYRELERRFAAEYPNRAKYETNSRNLQHSKDSVRDRKIGLSPGAIQRYEDFQRFLRRYNDNENKYKKEDLKERRDENKYKREDQLKTKSLPRKKIPTESRETTNVKRKIHVKKKIDELKQYLQLEKLSKLNTTQSSLEKDKTHTNIAEAQDDKTNTYNTGKALDQNEKSKAIDKNVSQGDKDLPYKHSQREAVEGVQDLRSRLSRKRSSSDCFVHDQETTDNKHDQKSLVKSKNSPISAPLFDEPKAKKSKPIEFIKNKKSVDVDAGSKNSLKLAPPVNELKAKKSKPIELNKNKKSPDVETGREISPILAPPVDELKAKKTQPIELIKNKKNLDVDAGSENAPSPVDKQEAKKYKPIEFIKNKKSPDVEAGRENSPILAPPVDELKAKNYKPKSLDVDDGSENLPILASTVDKLKSKKSKPIEVIKNKKSPDVEAGPENSPILAPPVDELQAKKSKPKSLDVDASSENSPRIASTVDELKAKKSKPKSLDVDAGSENSPRIASTVDKLKAKKSEPIKLIKNKKSPDVEASPESTPILAPPVEELTAKKSHRIELIKSIKSSGPDPGDIHQDPPEDLTFLDDLIIHADEIVASLPSSSKFENPLCSSITTTSTDNTKSEFIKKISANGIKDHENKNILNNDDNMESSEINKTNGYYLNNEETKEDLNNYGRDVKTIEITEGEETSLHKAPQHYYKEINYSKIITETKPREWLINNLRLKEINSDTGGGGFEIGSIANAKKQEEENVRISQHEENNNTGMIEKVFEEIGPKETMRFSKVEHKIIITINAIKSEKLANNTENVPLRHYEKNTPKEKQSLCKAEQKITDSNYGIDIKEEADKMKDLSEKDNERHEIQIKETDNMADVTEKANEEIAPKETTPCVAKQEITTESNYEIHINEKANNMAEETENVCEEYAEADRLCKSKQNLTTGSNHEIHMIEHANNMADLMVRDYDENLPKETTRPHKDKQEITTDSNDEILNMNEDANNMANLTVNDCQENSPKKKNSLSKPKQKIITDSKYEVNVNQEVTPNKTRRLCKNKLNNIKRNSTTNKNKQHTNYITDLTGNDLTVELCDDSDDSVIEVIDITNENEHNKISESLQQNVNRHLGSNTKALFRKHDGEWPQDNMRNSEPLLETQVKQNSEASLTTDQKQTQLHKFADSNETSLQSEDSVKSNQSINNFGDKSDVLQQVNNLDKIVKDNNDNSQHSKDTIEASLEIMFNNSDQNGCILKHIELVNKVIEEDVLKTAQTTRPETINNILDQDKTGNEKIEIELSIVGKHNKMETGAPESVNQILQETTKNSIEENFAVEINTSPLSDIVNRSLAQKNAVESETLPISEETIKKPPESVNQILQETNKKRIEQNVAVEINTSPLNVSYIQENLPQISGIDTGPVCRSEKTLKEQVQTFEDSANINTKKPNNVIEKNNRNDSANSTQTCEIVNSSLAQKNEVESETLPISEETIKKAPESVNQILQETNKNSIEQNDTVEMNTSPLNVSEIQENLPQKSGIDTAPVCRSEKTLKEQVQTFEDSSDINTKKPNNVIEKNNRNASANTTVTPEIVNSSLAQKEEVENETLPISEEAIQTSSNTTIATPKLEQKAESNKSGKTPISSSKLISEGSQENINKRCSRSEATTPVTNTKKVTNKSLVQGGKRNKDDPFQLYYENEEESQLSPKPRHYILKLELRMSEYLLEDYIISSVIHVGRFSTIYKCIDTEGRAHALKVVRQRTKGIFLERIFNQVQRYKRKQDSCILYLMNAFEFQDRWCLLTEYFPKNLEQALNENNRGFHIDQVQVLARQLVSAVKMVASANIIHTDIKQTHILLNRSQDRLKLCGFDRASYCNAMNITPSSGSPKYRAPEVILGFQPYHKMDVWCTGLIIFEMATNKSLFDALFNNGLLYEQMCTFGSFDWTMVDRCKYRHLYFSGCSFIRRVGDYGEEFIIEDSLEKNDNLREMLFESYNQYWAQGKSKWQITKEMDKLETLNTLLEQMLALDPRNRLPIQYVNASEFMNHSLTTA